MNMRAIIGGIALIFGLSFGYETEVHASDATEYTKTELEQYVVEVCEQYEICPEIIMALIERESQWTTDATNGPHKGLMQINPRWQKERMEELDVTNLYDGKQNILLGVDYFCYLHERVDGTEYDDIAYILMAYNMGEDKAKRKYSAGKISSYATWILERASELEQEHDISEEVVPEGIITYANETMTIVGTKNLTKKKGEQENHELEREV